MMNYTYGASFCDDTEDDLQSSHSNLIFVPDAKYWCIGFRVIKIK